MTVSEVTLNDLSTPKHIAIIMDGNGRWAKQRGNSVSFGHRAGVETIREILQACGDLNISVLTLYAFSQENWSRPKKEVSTLMRLFLLYLQKEVDELNKKKMRIRFIGSRDNFDAELLNMIEKTEKLTASNTKTTLVLAVDYGGDWDIIEACKKVTQDVIDDRYSVEDIDQHSFGQHMSLSDLPPPDLCIRTSGEYRISNFLLWQLAYAELYFTDVLWPDFTRKEFIKAINEFNKRSRRFGGRNHEE
jgi:undecaprenyl diphosphate synthase